MDPYATRELGRTDVHVTPLGFGGAPLGDLFVKLPEAAAEGAILQAYQGGVRYFDTSPWYGHGLSEHRLGNVLRRQPRDDFVLSTKVGRVYRAPDDPATFSSIPWVGGLPFDLTFDYGYDGILRSYEDSLMRLGLNRVDLLLIHDLDFLYHRDEAGVDGCLRQLEGSGWWALEELKAAGRIRGIGAGVNELGMIPRFLERFDIDLFLVAMPYTLLDQATLAEEFPRCAKRGVGIVIGATFASGILATGAVEGATYNYAPAGAEVLERVRRIEQVCRDHEVALPAAALQFPLGHDSVAAVIPGANSPQQAAQNARMMAAEIPAAFWDELRAAELISADAPTPQ